MMSIEIDLPSEIRMKGKQDVKISTTIDLFDPCDSFDQFDQFDRLKYDSIEKRMRTN